MLVLFARWQPNTCTQACRSVVRAAGKLRSKNIKHRLSCYSADKEQVLVFDRCDDLSATDKERMRRAGEDSTDYNLTTNNRDAVRKNKHNKREVSRVLSLFNVALDVTMDSPDDGAFTHDETGGTMIYHTC